MNHLDADFVSSLVVVADCSDCAGRFSYVLQAYSARRSEQSSSQEAQLLYVHETAREREHETVCVTLLAPPSVLLLLFFPVLLFRSLTCLR